MKLSELELPFWYDNDRPGASAKDLDDFENAVGVSLPMEFRRALQQRDGGTSNYSSFQREEYYVPLPSFFSVDALRDAERNRATFGTPEGVVAIASGGHEWLGLDYRLEGGPKVVFQEREDAELEVVASSFEEFLEGLMED